MTPGFSRTAVHIVWFKKDLRVQDHQPLVEAAARGPVLPLYLYEPEQLHHPEFGGHHLAYLNACLSELSEALQALGAPLVTRIGEAVDVFETLSREVEIAGVWAHEETGNDVSYQRDRRVRAWCRARGIPFKEFPQTGAVRRLGETQDWTALWERQMRLPVVLPPTLVQQGPVDSVGILTHAELGVAPNSKHVPAGGRRVAKQLLESFLTVRGTDYRREMSSPLTAETSCSRLSAPLAFGTVSLRETVQAARQRMSEVRGERGADPRWFGSLRSFEGRLYTRSYFVQRLETVPGMEFRELHSSFQGLRLVWHQERFDRWVAGETGYPLQDACMRMLAATGWLNFRMRAMTVSFATQLLWLHWRVPGQYLAGQWLDHEPGIHWSQMQMQSGTGFHPARIYNPTKQARDQDPEGTFIRRWIPELADVPTDFIHTPWLWSGAGQLKYPPPVIDAGQALKAAHAALSALRQTPHYQEEAQAAMARRSRTRTTRGPGIRPRSGRKTTSRPQSRAPEVGGDQPGLFEAPQTHLAPIVPSGLPDDWKRALAPEFSAPYFHDLTAFLKLERRSQTVYPPVPDVFNALRRTPLETVKVLILGQDPYHGAGQADGLSFSVPRGVRPPPSLQNVFQELQADLPDRMPPEHGDLSAWSAQGVLLLNTVLTVRAGQPKSHAGRGWEPFTDAVIRAVNARPTRVVFVLWGSEARRKSRLITEPQHLVIEAAHPSPLNVTGFKGSRPFSGVNAALVEAGLKPIDW